MDLVQTHDCEKRNKIKKITKKNSDKFEFYS